MSHHAQINENNIVTQVLVTGDESSPAIIEWLIETFGGTWIQTSYNTKGNIHYDSDGKPDGKEPLRYNFATIGGYYDSNSDAFYNVSPYPSWILNRNTYTWEPPVPYPEGQRAIWDEGIRGWTILPDPPPPGWSIDPEDGVWYRPNPLVP